MSTTLASRSPLCTLSIGILVLGACMGPGGVMLVPGAGGAETGEPPLEHVAPAGPAACDPRAVVDEPFLLEGDEVHLSFECSSGEPPTSFAAALTTEVQGATFDEDSWSVSWSTGFADGGRHDFLLAVRPADPAVVGQDALPETALGTVWIADALGHPANEPVVPSLYTEEWGLPVIHLLPHEPLSQEHVPTTIIFRGRTYDAEMKIRGAASVWYPKNSYNLRFGDEDLDTGELGLGTKDHLILITTFDDNSYAREKMAFDLWAAIADHWGRDRLTPRTFFAVVYMNGAYWGLYVACDRVDDHFAEEMGLSRDGNLYKAVNHDANFYTWDASGYDKGTLHQGYTKEEGEPEEGLPGAFDDLDQLVSWSSSVDHETFVAEMDGWLRTDEFMDWLLFVQYTSSDDSGGKNAYLYNDPEQPEFRFAPWDFNHSFGQGWTTYRIGPETFNDFAWNNGIFAHFQAHPETDEELWGRLHELMESGPLHLDWFTARLDEYYARIHPSAERDWSVWGEAYLDYWYGYNDLSYLEERAYLYDWLAQRDGWMWTYHPP